MTKLHYLSRPMKSKITLISLLWLLAFNTQYAQRANNWYFGSYAGLSFNSNPPTALSGGQINTPDCSSAISDVSGNLLFYTDGSTVWNSQHSAMVNGTGLLGSYTAGQSAIIVPIPCDPNRYVIFHLTDYANPGYLSYTVVDMSLNGGLGDVVSTQKNVSLGSGWTEKLCAYYNSVGNNYWVLSHKWNSDQFVAFNVTSSSIATQSVVTSIGSVHSCGTYGGVHDAMGQLTISRDGSKVLNAITCQDKFELFSFNSQTGVLSNSISISGNGGNAWATAFSPDNTKMYVNSIFGQSIFQYDISTYSQSSIAASLYTVYTTGSAGYNFGYMELGPDNKLYVAKPSSFSLSVINNPNSAGSSCNFSLAGPSLGTHNSNHGLTRIAYNIPLNGGGIGISASPSPTIPCSNQAVTLTANGSSSASNYTWTGPGIVGTYTGQSLNASSAGVYTCAAPACSGSMVTNSFTVFPTPTLSISATSNTLCEGSSATLIASGASTLTWLPGNQTGTSTIISPSVTSIYSVTSVFNSTCVILSTITITVNPKPQLNVTSNPTYVCPGTIVTLSVTGANSYTWQPGNIGGSSFSVIANSNLTYTVSGTDLYGCMNSSAKTVSVGNSPTIVISPYNPTVCLRGSITFTASGGVSYTWQPTGNTGSLLTIANASVNQNLTVTGKSPQGCTNTAIAQLSVVPLPTLTALANPTSACLGQTSTLTCFGASSYTWLPGGATGSVTTVNPLASTIYTVVGESNGCRDSSFVTVSNPVDPVILSAGEISCTQPTLQLQAVSGSSANIISWSGPGINGSSSPIVFVNTAGTYSLFVTDPLALCSGIATLQVINTIGPLSPTIIPSTTLACFPGPAVNLLISSPGSYTWYPQSDVSPSTGPLVSVSPSITSTYTLEAEQGICTGSAVITISVVPVPVVNLGSKTETLCAGKTLQLSADGADSYIWQPGALSGDTVTVHPLTTTIYTVMGYVSSCYSMQEVTVQVLPSPQLTVSSTAFALCVGNSATLNAICSDPVNWMLGGNTSSSNSVVVIPFGNSTYTAIGTNSLGCQTQATIGISAISIATISAGSSDTLVCAGTSVALNAGGSDNYTWTPGGLTGAQVTFSPMVNTTYTVYTSLNGCGSFTTVNVSVINCNNRSFGLTNAASKPELVGNSLYKINFTVTAVNNSNEELSDVYLWDELSKTFIAPCSFTLSDYVKIIPVSTKLVANGFFDGQAQRSLTMGEKSKLGANSRDTLLFSVLLDPHGYSGTVYNTVLGEALRSDGILVADSSNNGFLWDPDLDGDPTNNDTITPIEIPASDLFIPEGFTPDGNGQNDLFVISGLNGRRVKLEIFNRWGNKVYQNDNYDNSWDGRMNVNAPHFGAGKLPDGTYYYVLQFLDGEKKNLHGFVVLKY